MTRDCAMQTPDFSTMHVMHGMHGMHGVHGPDGQVNHFSGRSFKSFRPSLAGMSPQTTEHDTRQAGEILDFLTANAPKSSGSHRRSVYDEAVFQSECEHLTALCLLNVRDPELLRLLKECGWTGNRYSVPQGGRWDVDFLIQALSNYYLKNTNITANWHMENTFSIQSSLGRHRSSFDNITPFVSDMVIDALRSRPLTEPFSHPINGACMLADISGFSAYSGLMCSRGVTGLDELRSVTNGLLGHFVHTVYEFGGDVIAFAGDALICVFQDNPANNEDAPPAASCCVRALVCASLLCKDEAHHLSTHVAVTYGSMSLALLGGAHDQWVSLLTGDCINDLADCITKAGAKQVAANAACMEMLKCDAMAGGLLRSTKYDESGSAFLVTLVSADIGKLKHALEPAPRPVSLARQRAADGEIVTLDDDIMRMPMLTVETSSKKVEERSIAQQLVKFVPKPVKHALRGDVLDSIGELRQVTTVFLSLDSFDRSKEGKDPLKLQLFFLAAQKHLHQAGGFLRQFLVDDKGCVLIAMWGVPSFSYANNCSRAVHFAVALQHSVLELNHKCSVGISTGMVFCGIIGADARKDYVGIGTDVNIAARLMSKAHERILADSTTFHNCNQSTREMFVPAEQLLLKGMPEPIVPYCFSSQQLPPLTEADHLDSTFLLQRAVTSMIDEHLDRVSNAEVDMVGGDDGVDLPKSALFVLGPGAGKSTANHYFRQGAHKRGMKSILLQVQLFHKGVPYSVVRMLLMELIGSGEADSNNAVDAQGKLLKRLISTAFPHLAESEIDSAYYSLEQVLGRTGQTEGSFIVHPRTSSIEEEWKRDIGLHQSRLYVANIDLLGDVDSPRVNRLDTRKCGEAVLCRVLMLLLCQSGPYAIILENGHLCDELSWRFIDALFSQRDMQILLMVTVLVKVNVARREGTLCKQDLKARRGMVNAGSNVDVDEILDSISKSATSASMDERDNVLRSATSETETALLQPPSGSSTVLNNAPRSRITRKLESQFPVGCLALMSRKVSGILELGGLNNTEVKEILTASLHVDTVSDSLVQLVMDVSSGNPFWCSTIANFIKERGLSKLEEARKNDADSHSIHKLLVVCRLDHLTVDELIVLKHASIIGYDFTYKLLQSIVPHKVLKNLDKHTGALVEQGFIQCIEEVPELRFCFAHLVFQSTLYDLTLPTDAALVHLSVAECLEVSNSDHLQPFYPILGYHYKRCGASHHHLAFKFELKSADQAIAHGAFEEGLEFAKSSFSLAQTHSELLVLLDVLATALEDMSYNSAPSPLFSLKASCEDGRQFSTSPADILSASSNMGENLSLWEEDKLIKDFSALKREVEQASADKLQSESTAPARHQVIVPNKPASGFLTWQASYTKRKRDEQIITIGVHSSDSMPSLPEEPPASTASQACCTIS